MDGFCWICHLRFGSAENRIKWGNKEIHEGCFLEKHRKARAQVMGGRHGVEEVGIFKAQMAKN